MLNTLLIFLFTFIILLGIIGFGSKLLNNYMLFGNKDKLIYKIIFFKERRNYYEQKI